MQPVESDYAPPREVALRRVLGVLAQGGTDPTVQRDGEIWWLTLRFPHGTASLALRPAGAAIRATAWGTAAEAAMDLVPGLLGADDDDEGFDHARHPLVAELHRRAPGLRLARTTQVLAALIPAILFQKVTAKEAKASWRRLLQWHGEPAPGPAPIGMRVAPDPATWRRIPSWDWHRAGVGPQRSDTIMRAVHAAGGLERTAGVAGPEARRRMRTIPGIGEWTAAETAQRSHGDPDAVSFGDFHTCKRVGWALTGARVDDDGMRELLEPWAGHRQRVIRLIEASGAGDYERHGPRMTIADYRAF
ncbi:DNA-3-methyladenine glycosylase family protein [Homoserinibacter sp. YIM 151385]|uniref:DNA-3-methyladenine glycosylase family protein n=1 Tax=Homoserinibacter sp. YIM 151385 TaxID=2985506 RepID=UPI0022EFFF24|nr:DNA-3-methyladenine glycosylase 2 family protein [Homoserinibacter sp. YIM 151385]WBU37171.1 DNA-3-methyladenine glycosylase 2 family protein [Homoserinibacter sp. YIM 151385]